MYNGKQFINVEVKPDMIGHYLAEFSITYKPIRPSKGDSIGKTKARNYVKSEFKIKIGILILPFVYLSWYIGLDL